MQCHLCGSKLAESLKGRENHMVLYHNVKLKYRTKSEIVKTVEERLCRFILDPKKCLEQCACERCFQATLDRLVEKSEERTRAIRSSFSFHDDVSGH